MGSFKSYSCWSVFRWSSTESMRKCYTFCASRTCGVDAEKKKPGNPIRASAPQFTPLTKIQIHGENVSWTMSFRKNTFPLLSLSLPPSSVWTPSLTRNTFFVSILQCAAVRIKRWLRITPEQCHIVAFLNVFPVDK